MDNTSPIDFLTINQITLDIEYIGNKKHFPDDKDKRDCYNITISRNGKSYSFEYGDSIANSEYRKYKSYQDFLYAYGKDSRNSFYSRKFCFGKIKPSEFIELKKGPKIYGILCCIGSDCYDYGTFQDWCDMFGTTTDSRKALEQFLKMQEQKSNIERVLTNEQIKFIQENFQ